MIAMKPNFGVLVNAYDTMRPRYPKQTIRLVRRSIKGKLPLVLDIGCGTGISTRQMAESGATVIGADIDQRMLEAAMAHSEGNVAYVLSAADKLPFRDHSFDAVTAFQALHWFSDRKSLKELKRVLRMGGVLAVVQPKRDANTMTGEIRELLRKRFPKNPAPTYFKQDLRDTLKSVGFKSVTVSTARKSERYTLNDYLVLLQSHSFWNQVPGGRKSSEIGFLRRYLRARLENGYVYDRYAITVFIAKR